jgi:AraC-like DNA-binding protein
MDLPLDEGSFHPFFYHGRTLNGRAGHRVQGPAERWCLTLWMQLDGTTVIERGPGRFLLRPGQVAVCDPGVAASWRASGRVIRLVFDVVDRPRRRSVRRLLIPAEERPHPSWQDAFGVPAPGPWEPSAVQRELIHNLAGSGVTRPREAMLAHQHLGLLVLSLLSSPPTAVTATAGPTRPAAVLVHQARQFMVQRLSQGVRVTAIAARLGVTTSYLARCFRKELACPPREMLDRLRLEAATRALAAGQPIDQVAQAVGLAGGRSLRVLFRRGLGLSPRAWHRRWASGDAPGLSSIGCNPG